MTAWRVLFPVGVVGILAGGLGLGCDPRLENTAPARVGPTETVADGPTQHQQWQPGEAEHPDTWTGSGDTGPRSLTGFVGRISGRRYELTDIGPARRDGEPVCRFHFLVDGEPWVLEANAAADGILWTVIEPEAFELEIWDGGGSQAIVHERTEDEWLMITITEMPDGRMIEHYLHSGGGVLESEADFRRWLGPDSGLHMSNSTASVVALELLLNPTLREFLENQAPAAGKNLPKCFRVASKLIKVGTLVKCTYGGGIANALCEAGVVLSAGCLVVEIAWDLFAPEEPEEPDPDPDPDPGTGRERPGARHHPGIRLSAGTPLGEWR